jgi:nucleotide-binding universal stress UspA family protein
LGLAAVAGADMILLVAGGFRDGAGFAGREEARAAIARAKAWGRDRGVAVSGMALGGAVAPAIIDAVRETGADLVVMPKDRRGVLGFLLPSVSARVAASLDCPVLTVDSRTRL